MCGECNWPLKHLNDSDDKNYSLSEMIEIAKQSEYGAIWHSEKGPIHITKYGNLEPIIYSE